MDNDINVSSNIIFKKLNIHCVFTLTVLGAMSPSISSPDNI